MDSDSDLNEFEEDSEENSLFQKAAEFVQLQSTQPGGKQLEQKKMLDLYGYYKVATVGKCKDPKPGMFDLRGKAKWNAWQQVSDLSTQEATQKYIDCVKNYYQWKPLPVEDLAAGASGGPSSSGDSAKKSGFGGNAVSIMARPDLEDDDSLDKDTIFAWVKDNSLHSIETWLKSGNDPNVTDSEGMSPLHWSVDRGHLDACILLLNAGANINLEDYDGQTPMDYAVCCEHQQIVSLLEDRLNSTIK